VLKCKSGATLVDFSVWHGNAFVKQALRLDERIGRYCKITVGIFSALLFDLHVGIATRELRRGCRPRDSLVGELSIPGAH